ncbi:hypothetical protein XENOCAPTIV_021543 [Xenoophorus captivus]|uniref:Uncharacterized protein n=1 Tax=Xenoophorus captivus TaxID=1517983 RepID=A0ABV0RJG6_9TELE
MLNLSCLLSMVFVLLLCLHVLFSSSVHITCDSTCIPVCMPYTFSFHIPMCHCFSIFSPHHNCPCPLTFTYYCSILYCSYVFCIWFDSLFGLSVTLCHLFFLSFSISNSCHLCHFFNQTAHVFCILVLSTCPAF